MRIRNIIIYVVVCIIIFASFNIPNILLESLVNNFEKEVYAKSKNETILDVETEKIYLVHAIHEIESENKCIQISSNKNRTILVESVANENIGKNNINDELINLRECNILNKLELKETTSCSIGIIDKYYQEDKETYVVSNILVYIDDKKYNIEVECKTGKILSIYAEKKELNISDKEKLMRNYIKYLDLNIIDDWNYENSVLKSEKAKLVVNLEKNDNYYKMSIHSTERKYNYLIDTKRIRKLYKIETTLCYLNSIRLFLWRYKWNL